MTPRDRLRISFAGGGTGGHIVPGLHLLERTLQELGANSERAVPVIEDLLWFTSGRAVEDRVLESVPDGFPWKRQVLALEPAGGGAPSHTRLLLKTPGSFLTARRELRKHRTQVLLGLGGFTTLPAVLAARSLGIPVALLEINAASGKATRSLQRFATRIFHAWKGTLPGAVEDARQCLTGAPVSPSVSQVGSGLGSREEALEALAMDRTRPLLLVLGGSQGAGSLNGFMRTHRDDLLQGGLQVLHQCGPGKRSALPADSAHFRAVEFLAPISRALQASTLVLCRGGASTLAEVAAAQRAALVVPYPHHTDGHQERNAKELGAGIRLVKDEALNAACAAQIVHLALESGALERAEMERELGLAGHEDAAARILEELQQLAVKPT